MKLKCSVCGEVFELQCDGPACTKSLKMQQHEHNHNSKGESIDWIVD